MNLPVELDYDFESKLQSLKKTYDYSYMKITGFKPQQLSFTTYIKEFVEAQNRSDNSIDGTSNSDKKDVVALLSDINKPILKLTAFNKIYTKIKEKYGVDTANDWLESEYLGKSYLHDAHTSSLIPYCYAYDLTRLANEGLFFISQLPKTDVEDFDGFYSEFGNQSNVMEPYNAEPAQHLDTFVNLVKEFVSWCCNRQAGAVGLPNLVPYLYYFWLKDLREGYNGTKITKNKDGKEITGIEEYPKLPDNQNIRYFKQQVQALIYALNQPFLRGGIQSAFTNVSIFDHEYAHALFDGIIFPDGTLALDHIDNIVIAQQIFLSVVSAIRNKNMFTFPVLSYSLLTEEIKVDDSFESKFEDKEYYKKAKEYIDNLEVKPKTFIKFKDEKFARWASDHNTQWMDSNFFIDDSITSLSNCCRLKSDITDLGYFNSIGGTALSVGSVKVNTVNLANIAYSVLDEEEKGEPFKGERKESLFEDFFKHLENKYLEKLKNQVYINLKCLDVIREIIVKNAEVRDLLPNICSNGLIDLKHMYNTVGFIGIYETLKAFQNHVDKIKSLLGNVSLDDLNYIHIDDFGNYYYTKKAENFVKCLFETMQSTFTKFKTEYNINYSINCEQIPGETAASKLMKKDAISYPDLVVQDLPLYGNQFIPLGVKTTLEERVRIAALFDSYCNGGSIAHLNYASTFPNTEIAWEKLIWLAQQKLTYSAFTTKINVCKHNHAFFGKVCPVCGGSVYTTYVRIVGFYVPFCTFDTPRQEETKLREWED